MTTFRTVHEIEIDFNYNLKYFEKEIAPKVDKITKCIFRTMIRFLLKKEYKSAISYWLSKEHEWSNRDSKMDYFRSGYMEIWISSRKEGNNLNTYKDKNMESITMNQLIRKLQYGILESI